MARRVRAGGSPVPTTEKPDHYETLMRSQSFGKIAGPYAGNAGARDDGHELAAPEGAQVQTVLLYRERNSSSWTKDQGRPFNRARA